MLSRRRLDVSVLIGAVALSRFLFRSHYLYDLDSVNFALAIGRFDPMVHQPHPPGYFLYVCLGRLVNLLFREPNAALVTISIAASCGAAATIYLLADDWFGVSPARFSGAIFLASPLAWFHGIVALTYIVEAFSSALIGYVLWRVYQGSIRWIFPGAVALGLAAGVRPSSLLFLGPLFLFSLWRTPRLKALGGIAVLAATVMAWFAPMIYASGGADAYFSALSFLWGMSPGRQNALNSLLLLSVARLFTVAGVVILCFGSAIALFARALWTRNSGKDRPRAFTWMWITPALLFFIFVFLRFINSGYLLVIFPPLCVWAGWWASDWYSRLAFSVPVKAVLVTVAAAINVAIFLEAPVYCSYGQVRSFESDLEAVERALAKIGTAEQTLIVGFDSHFLGFRHAGYYLPNYTIVEYPEVRFPTGIRVFTMHNRDTRLVERIAAAGFTNILLFPLPRPGAEYQKHSTEMHAKYPGFKTTSLEGFEFMSAPIEDLRVLFPVVAIQGSLVSTAGDFAAAPVYKR
jgi:hypothetical protein